MGKPVMIDYMKRQERYIRDMLAKNLDPEELKKLLEYHSTQIQWMQHERMAHLITMLFVCLFTLLAFGFTIANPILPCFLLCILLTILSVAYVIHYYRLENGVQKWYELSNEIRLSNK
jgi:hypothetical protein